ncbi:dolichol phosphate-mannose biosynthesis regulatory [Abortiporus biennis]|nr:dolichol phosphate-mannose biosynthesis regulatory [Abortiporus biennis]
MPSDKALGSMMLLGAGLSFVYYTLWVILLPFFDSSSPVHDWFPPREWAIRIPVTILVVGISAIGFLISSKILLAPNRGKMKS